MRALKAAADKPTSIKASKKSLQEELDSMIASISPKSQDKDLKKIKNFVTKMRSEHGKSCFQDLSAFNDLDFQKYLSNIDTVEKTRSAWIQRIHEKTHKIHAEKFKLFHLPQTPKARKNASTCLERIEKSRQRLIANVEKLTKLANDKFAPVERKVSQDEAFDLKAKLLSQIEDLRHVLKAARESVHNGKLEKLVSKLREKESELDNLERESTEKWGPNWEFYNEDTAKMTEILEDAIYEDALNAKN